MTHAVLKIGLRVSRFSRLLQVKAIDLICEENVSTQPLNPQKIKTLSQLYKALDGLYKGIDEYCSSCNDPDCMGYVWLLKQEAKTLYEHGVSMIQTDNGSTFIHSFPENKLGELDLAVRYPPCPHVDNRRCNIHQSRPLNCRLYPIGLEVKDGKIIWAIHLDCLYTRKLEEHGLLIDFKFRAKNVINNLSSELLKEIVETYQKVYAITFFPYGENNYQFLQEVNYV